MDWLRNTLLIGMVGVVMALVFQWSNFTPPESAVAQSTNSAAMPSDTPATNSASDVPSAISNEQQPEILVSTDLIKVTTPQLYVEINPVGGDIETVSLIDHTLDQETGDPLPLLLNRPGNVYIAQSGLIGPNGTDGAGARPTFNSEAREYTLSGDSLSVDLTFEQTSGVTIIKRFTFTEGEHTIDVNYLVDNQASTEWRGYFYGQIKRDTSAPLIDNDGAMQPFLGMATTKQDENFVKRDFEDLSETKYSANVNGGWVAMVQHYFISAWVPTTAGTNRFYGEPMANGFFRLGFTSDQQIIAAGESASFGATFYAGPKDQEKLSELGEYLDLTVDYGWLWWIAKPLFAALDLFHDLLGNWGFAIIALTILIKGLFYYPSAISYRSMATMRKFTPRIQEIRERYSDDRQQQQKAMMELYKQEKINPMAGCLPILLQMPVFIALYWMLAESVELRHAPFVLWIQDLSVKDPYFVLPVAMGVVMFLQQRLNPTPPDPMQAKIMQFMPIIFTFFFMFFPAGLVLYWLFNSLISMLQQIYVYRGIEKDAAKK